MDNIIHQSPLFAGLSAGDTDRALEFFGGFRRHYSKGEFLHRLLAPMDHFALVLSGHVQVYMDDLDGYQMIMANVEPGGIFGDSLCFLGETAPVYIVAMTDCNILWMDVKNLKAPGIKTDFQRDLANRFTAMVCHRALSMNDRIQVLSKNTLRGKLITFFSQYVQRSGDAFTIPFDRESMASYLGVNRSALSRELGAMEKEGIISFHKNKFTIHHKIIE